MRLFDQRLLGELVFHGGTALRMLHDHVEKEEGRRAYRHPDGRAG